MTAAGRSLAAGLYIKDKKTMDLICLTCGEPWEIDTVLHEDPAGFRRKGCAIRACPACQGIPPRELPAAQRDRLEEMAALAALLGNDIDGFAALLEDFQLK